MSQSWTHFRHEADIGVRGSGATLAEAFEQAALALTAAVADPSTIRQRQRIEIHCENADPEYLLVDWLNALVYEMATRRMLFSRYKVTIEQGGLRASAWGEPVDVGRHQPAVEVKGATLTELHVARDAAGQWQAQCVVDV